MPPLLLTMHNLFLHRSLSILAASQNLSTGLSPLKAARREGHTEVVRLLEAAGLTLKHHLRKIPDLSELLSAHFKCVRNCTVVMVTNLRRWLGERSWSAIKTRAVCQREIAGSPRIRLPHTSQYTSIPFNIHMYLISYLF